MAASYQVWINSLQISNLAVESIKINRRRSDLFDRLNVGECDILVDGSRGAFTTGGNAIKLNHPVNVLAVDGTSSYNLFNGFVEKFSMNPQVGEQRMVVSCGDIAGRLRQTIQTSLQVYVNQETVFRSILAAANVASTQYVMGSFPEVVAFAYQDQVSAGDAINEVQQAGASYVFVDGAGRINFANRNFDVVSSAAISSFASFFELSYSQKVDNLVNDCTVRVTPRLSGPLVSTVAVFDDSLFIAGVSSTQMTLESIDGTTSEDGAPIFSVSTPVNRVNYFLTEGPNGIGPDLSSQCVITITPFARSVSISISNNGTRNAYLSGLTLFGAPASKGSDIIRNLKDQASINSFQNTPLELQANILQTPDYADGLASYVLYKNAQPTGKLEVSIKNKTPSLFELELNKHMFISNSLMGINSSFVISSLEHSIVFDGGTEHTLSMDLELRPLKRFFVLDSSVQGRLDIDILGI